MLNCRHDNGQLTLEGDLHVAFLDSLMDCLEQVSPLDQAVHIDLSRITAADIAGLQVLLSFLRSRDEAAPARLKEAPPAFLKALELSGLREHFAHYLD